MLLEFILIPALAAICGALLSSPLVCWAARRLGVTDRPDAYRKLHGGAIPLGGGICVAIGMLVGIYYSPLYARLVGRLTNDSTGSVYSLIGAGVFIVILGLFDDRIGLRGRHKLIGQIAVALLLTYCGYLVQSIQVLGLQVELGFLAVPFTVGWFVLAINSINLIDGIDGLATVVGTILSFTLCCVAVLSGHMTEAVVLAVLAGGLIGFLPFNFPPAKMFLGDTGSMLIGLVLGAMAIRGSLKGPATVALAAPLAVWTIPLFDTLAAVLRRKLTGRSIYATDRGHLHHCLQQLSGSNRRTLYWIFLACGGSCIGALSSVYLKSDLIALVSALSVISVLVATRAFGYGEFMLLSHRVRSIWKVFSSVAEGDSAVEHAVRLQGSKPWEVLWKSLLEVTDDFNLARASLDVNVPASHEGYHVTWKRPMRNEDLALWHVDMPLHSENQLIGRLRLSGPYNGFSACTTVASLMELLMAFEDDFNAVLRGSPLLQPAAEVGAAAEAAAGHTPPMNGTQHAAVPSNGYSESGHSESGHSTNGHSSDELPLAVVGAGKTSAAEPAGLEREVRMDAVLQLSVHGTHEVVQSPLGTTAK